MIKINSEFILKNESNGFELMRMRFKTHSGKVGTKGYTKLDKPVEVLASIGTGIYPTDILSASKIVRRIYTQDLANEDKIYEINQVIEYLKEKGM